MTLLYAIATIAIPIVVVVLWRWRRAQPATRRNVRAGLLAAMALLAAAWVPVAGFTTVLVLLEEPWPLSLRQGPDTASAKAIFQQRLGFEPPPAMTNLYAREAFAGLGEHTTFIAFTYLDEGVIEAVVTKAALRRVPDGDVGTLRAQPGPAWFPVQDVLRRLPEAYRQNEPDHPDVFRHLWIDRANRRVYFQDVDTA